MRERLREITREAHERLHGHDGFAAAAAGTIGAADYRDLLARLYGFHAAFDARMAAAPPALAHELDLAERGRAALIAEDLAGLGAAPAHIAALPLCGDMPPMRSAGDCLGALYVAEGSTLGGQLIARALGDAVGDNRRFFLGHGGEHSRLWRRFLARLESLDAEPAEAAAAERSALAAFAAFERWMAPWRGAYNETFAAA
jgi:heme oxygenase